MYNGIPPYYDDIFQVRDKDMDFFRTAMSGKRRLLDIGCGTGKISALFAESERNVVGVDLSAEMIAQANTTYASSRVTFSVLDMTRIAEAFAPASFDGVLCLGNTLVHLTQPQVLQRFLDDMHALLTQNGVSIIQILNYDRIRARNIRELPLLETPDLRFIRRYEQQGALLRFITRLEVKASGEVIENDTPLLPLSAKELETMLHKAGFASVALHGDFSGGGLQEDSFVTVAICQ